jgi:hypothetical protein
MQIYKVAAACFGALVLMQVDFAQAQSRAELPIPGIDIVVRKDKPGMKAAPDKPPKQNRSAINTSRSNIKYQKSAAPGKPPKAGIANSYEVEDISITNRKAAPGGPALGTRARTKPTATKREIKQDAVSLNVRRQRDF